MYLVIYKPHRLNYFRKCSHCDLIRWLYRCRWRMLSMECVDDKSDSVTNIPNLSPIHFVTKFPFQHALTNPNQSSKYPEKISRPVPFLTCFAYNIFASWFLLFKWVEQTKHFISLTLSSFAISDPAMCSSGGYFRHKSVKQFWHT